VTTFIEVLIVRVLQGLSGGTAALSDAYVLDVVPSCSRASYMGLAGAVKGMAFVFGPGIGALLIVMDLSRRKIFLVTGGLAFLAGGLGLKFLDESLPKEKRRPLCGKQEDAGVEAADWEGMNSGLICIWFARFISALGLGFLFATYAFLIKDNFGWSDMHFGIVLLASGLCSACFQLLAFPRVVAFIGAGWSLCVGAAFGTVAFALLPKESVAVHIFGLALFTLSGAMLEPAFPVLIALFASDRHLGFANGIVASCRALATMSSPLIAGMLYKRSPHLAYHTAAACFAIASLTAAGISVLASFLPSEADRLVPKACDKA
jgi:MFS family permease